MGTGLQQFGRAIGAYGQAFRYLLKPGYRNYLVLPILVNLLFLVLVIGAALQYAEPLLQTLLNWFNVDINTWHSTLATLAILALQLLSFLLFLSVYKYLVLIVLAPFLAFLSEKVEKDLAQQEFPFSWQQFAADVFRALLINGYNLLRELGLTLLLALLGFVPLVGLFSPIAILAVQSYFYGYGLLDYNVERWRFSIGQTEKYMWRNKGQTLGVGLLFHFIFLIPVVGWIVAPIWAVIAGSLSAIAHQSNTTT